MKISGSAHELITMMTSAVSIKIFYKSSVVCKFSQQGSLDKMTCAMIYISLFNMSRIMRKRDFCLAKTKAQISFAVTAKLISAFVIATRIVQFLFYLNPKFQASSSFLSLYRPVCVGPGRKPRRPVF